MLVLFQLFLAAFAIYSALTFEEEARLIIPLVCLIFMFIVGRADRKNTEKERARKNFLKAEIDKISQKDSATIKEQDFFTIETLLWPKSELLLLDAVHAIFKDLGFMISPGIHYQSVDRIVKIPNAQKSFGLQVMMCQGEAEKSHPKITRLLQFETDKKENEKTLIIASTHIRLPLSERNEMSHISKDLIDLLIRQQISFITAHHLYSLWQKAKKGEIDIFKFFQKIYFQRSGIYPQKGIENLFSHFPEIPIQ
ncbi:MAG: hypothetical protein A2V86_07525 [Deltaproteobacteria bacterium RBG_16_49_23]|nr:MAG: hypothetical protein A2V86_07525 [Deltaproteobacteria bacterium RBG_16_49_23]